jgi:hypothetical protein
MLEDYSFFTPLFSRISPVSLSDQNRFFVSGRPAGHELSDGLKDNLKLLIRFIFQFIQSTSQVFIGDNHFPEFDKSPHHENVYFYGLLTVKDTGKHGYALLGKNLRKVLRLPWPAFEVANCDLKTSISSSFN